MRQLPWNRRLFLIRYGFRGKSCIESGYRPQSPPVLWCCELPERNVWYFINDIARNLPHKNLPIPIPRVVHYAPKIHVVLELS